MIKNWKKFNEDVYFPPEREDDHKEILTKFVDEWVYENLGSPEEFSSWVDVTDWKMAIGVHAKMSQYQYEKLDDSFKEVWKESMEEMLEDLKRLNFNYSFSEERLTKKGFIIQKDL